MKKYHSVLPALVLVCSALLSYPTRIFAGLLPPSVTPQQSYASILITQYTVNGESVGDAYSQIAFWNVGQLSENPEYAKAISSGDCSKSTTRGCGVGAPVEGTFSGGPNGVAKIGSYEYKLINGAYFELMLNGKVYKYTVDNPAVFANWPGMESLKPITYDATSQFLDPWNETFPPDTHFDENEAVISKLYGDVDVSDPANKKNIIQQGVTSFKILLNDMLFGRHPKTAHTEGDTQVENSDSDVSNRWQTPFKGVRLTDGYMLRTGNGRAVVEFADGTKFILREHSTISFNKNGIYLDNGKFMFMFRKLGKKIYIYSKTAIYTITGTQFEMTVTPDGSTLQVYEGSVVAGSLVSKKLTSVKAGEEVTVSKTELGSKTTVSEETNRNMDAIEAEIIDAQLQRSKVYSLYILGGLSVFCFAVMYFMKVFSKRRV